MKGAEILPVSGEDKGYQNMYHFLLRKMSRRLALALTACSYALLLLLILAKWGAGAGAFRYLNI